MLRYGPHCAAGESSVFDILNRNAKSTKGAAVRRCMLAVAMCAALVTGVPASAYTAEDLWAEFDASRLTSDEKRFLQFGLSLNGKYVGLMDGAWGNGSQRALEAWAKDVDPEPPVENWEVIWLAVEIADRFKTEGWDQRYFDFMDISFAVPVGQMQEEPASEAFLNYAHRGSSLRYSLNVGDLPQIARIHEWALSSAPSGAVPYTLRRENVNITSVEQQDGSLVYVRSDLRAVGWSTVVVSAAKRDQNLLNAVSGSITKGPSGMMTLPSDGELAEGFESLATFLESVEEGQPGEPPGPTAMQEGATAPPSVTATPLPETATAPPLPAAPESSGPLLQGTGTAFVVSDQGHMLTNAHVVQGCETIKIEGRSVSIVGEDENFDLALLKDLPPANGAVAHFAARPAALNADITVAGYPLAGLLSGLNVTRGSVSSLKGMAGDSIRMQISAPVQPGNSGGPAVDEAGRVVGVVVSKLDAQMVSEAIGDIPQNVNFAVRGEIAKLFMFQNGVEPTVAEDTAEPLNPVETARQLEQVTRLVECYATPK